MHPIRVIPGARFPDHMDLHYLVIEGNIGAGKTSLARRIASDLKARLVLERFAENPFLPRFYENPERFSFPLELSFLADRYNQLVKEVQHKDLFAPLTISDYYFQKSLVFASNTLQDDEFALYRQLFQIIYPSLPKPDLLVYLHLPVEQNLKNIRLRGRDFESGISRDYLERIHRGYMEFFRQNPDLRVAVIDTSQLDFVHQDEDYHWIQDCIFCRNYEPGLNFITGRNENSTPYPPKNP